jgi:hypothetical protein
VGLSLFHKRARRRKRNDEAIKNFGICAVDPPSPSAHLPSCRLRRAGGGSSCWTTAYSLFIGLLGSRGLPLVLAAEFGQFGSKAVPQWVFRTEFLQQRFGLGESFLVPLPLMKQIAPASRDFLLA